MKIAYVTINVDPKIMDGGVGNKIRKQISIWELMGHSTKVFSLTPAPISIPSANLFIFNNAPKVPGLNILIRENSRSLGLIRLLSALRKYKPDLIYFRFGLFTFPLQYLFKIAPTVLEVNSNDLDEYRARGNFFYWLNRITRNVIFSRCAGWVFTSYELANLQQNQKYKKQTCIISNGIELDKYKFLLPTNNQTPVLTLVGSPGMNWHGVDKLFYLAQTYSDLEINIIGYQSKDFDKPIPSNMHLHGYLTPEHVRKILTETDVVFGTLALHRKRMNEASPLKVREALSYGIPIILAYQDTDLIDIKSDQILLLPNTEDNVIENAKRIREFAFQAIGKRIDRNSISDRIDQRLKEKKRLVDK